MKISNCPICGLPWSESIDEEEIRHSYQICECCGCEYGYDDNPAYRDNWLKQDSPWFNPKQRPADWKLAEQLLHIIPHWNAR